MSEAERDRFIRAAIELHEACCAPHLDVRSDHYRTLSELNEQIVGSLQVITGEVYPPWVGWRTSQPAPAG